MIDFKFHIKEEWDSGDIRIYGVSYGAEYQGYYLTVKDGIIQFNPKEEGEIIKEPFLTLTRHQPKRVLNALVDALKDFGYVAELDNKERITAQAIAEERKEQIGWFRKQIENQL